MNEEGIKKLLNKVDVLDESDLRNLTKALWKQREFFKKIFDVIRDAIVVINQKGEIIYCNKSACDLLGIPMTKPTNLLWKYIPEFLVFSDYSFLSNRENDTVFSKEIKISYPQKSLLSITVTCGCGVCDDGDKTFVLRIADITHEREASEKFLDSEKTSSIMFLASGVAHEIGNPLNALALRLQLMKRQFTTIKNPKEQETFDTSLKVCLEEISRLDGIVKNFLQAIRPRKPEMSDVSLARLLRESIDVMSVEFKSLNIIVVNNVTSTPTILGDANQLKQVFFNILKNSREAISCNGTIIIDTDNNNDDVIITFTDNGVGISCEILDQVFVPYFSTKPHGSGLGMMIAKRILSDHGATMDIASTKNVGTKISIVFPRKDKLVPLLHSDGGKNCDMR